MLRKCLIASRIPFERALDFANKEKITDLLYPLFVHNIGGLLYNSENAPRTNAVVAATERRRMDSIDSTRAPQSAQSAPGLHHHHSMQGNVGGQAPPTPHSIAPHPNAGRPGIDRAHTFPTPPTSASSVLGMGNQGSSYEWGGQNLPNGVSGSQPLAIDTGINARSMPTTPATTPPSNTNQGVQGYQGQPGYEKNVYNTTPGSQTGYSQHSDPARYSQDQQYAKTDMGPPHQPATSLPPHESGHVSSHGHPEHDHGDHHETAYMHNNPSAYGATRNHYGYPQTQDHPHLSPEMTGSPHQSGSGRGTPRTMPSSQPQWGSDYQTPPRQGTSSNVYNVMGNTGASNVPSSGNNYASSYPAAGVKRGRDDEDERPSSRDYDYGAKRQKSGRQDNFGMPLQAPHMQAIKSGGQR